ncbi:MAG: hypothetical protein NZ929_07635 [Aigarchaeota archaeon]|nr:hypothetical protein [Aigarchaeota archaeon]
MVRLRFSGEEFYLDRLNRWYIEDKVKRRLGGIDKYLIRIIIRDNFSY